MRDPSDFDVLSLPGFTQFRPDHWQTHWERILEHASRRDRTIGKFLSIPIGPFGLPRQSTSADAPVLLVAHSLGTALVARWSQEADTRAVAGAFLVATVRCRSARCNTRVSDACFAPVILDGFRSVNGSRQP